MSRPDEGLIHAWLDGELPPEEAARVERLVAEDAEWAAAAAEARGLVAASSRILRALDHVPGDVIPAGGSRAPVRRPFASRVWVRIAAGVVLVAGVSVALRMDIATESGMSTALTDAVTPSVGADSIATSPGSARDIQPPSTIPTIGSGAAATISAPRDARVDAPRERTMASAERQLDAPSPSPAPPPPTRSAPAQSPAALSADVAPANAPALVGAASAERERLEAQRDAASQVEQRAASALRQRREAAAPTAPSAQAFRGAAKALSVQALDGCWRVTTTAGADSLLVTPRVLRTDGDTLVVDAGVIGRPAYVARDGDDTLRGEMPDANGRRVPFTAARVECPVPSTPAPRR